MQDRAQATIIIVNTNAAPSMLQVAHALSGMNLPKTWHRTSDLDLLCSMSGSYFTASTRFKQNNWGFIAWI